MRAHGLLINIIFINMIVLSVLVAVLAVGLAYLYVSFKISYRFWQQRNVPSLPPKFPMGNVQDTLYEQKHFAFISQDLYKQLKPHGDYGGLHFFNKPHLLVLTPEFAKTVLVRDFQYFVDRGVYYNKKHDPLSANLFFIEGDEWRRLRAKVSPTFTSGKMKSMFHMILHVGDELVKHLNGIIAGGGGDEQQPVNVREYLARFTTDVIGTCAFGLDCNSIVNPKSEFREMGKKMFNFTKLQSLKLFFSGLMRKQARALGVQFNTTEVNEFVMQLVKKTIKYRRENNVHRNDFMQLMMELYKEDDASGDGLTIEDIAAQSFVFFFAGFETSSTTMTYALYELAMNPSVQTELRAEIESVTKDNQSLSYENVTTMTYLDKVINGKIIYNDRVTLFDVFIFFFFVSETLRKYPAVATLHRIVDKDYELPNGSVLPAGTFLVIPTYAFHHDPENFPMPEKFDPERFSDGERATRHPYAFLPFGEGPRICIGMRFGLLQTKIGLSMLVKHFRFSTCSATEVPIKIDQINMLFVPMNGLMLKVERI